MLKLSLPLNNFNTQFTHFYIKAFEMIMYNITKMIIINEKVEDFIGVYPHRLSCTRTFESSQ